MPVIVAATYTPEMQVITLRKEFTAFADPENLVGFTTPEQVAMFTHEWVHYLHNVSTTLGLTTFCTLTTMWSNFRWSFDPNGWSDSGRTLSADSTQSIELSYRIMQTLRGKSASSLPRDALLEFSRVTKAALALDSSTHPYALNRLTCDVEYGDPAGTEFVACQATIGSHEILECAAFLLEERACIALGVNPQRPSLDPYLLVLAAARFLAPSLDKESVLLATLASLQYPDPPSALKELLESGENASDNALDPKEAIRDTGMRMLIEGWKNALATLQLVDELFPIDEPMARAIKLTTARMRRNMLRRKEDLFFEIDLIDQLRNGPAILEEAIRTYGAPLLIQERSAQDRDDGADGDFCRDVMYDFSKKEMSLQAMSDGWRLMHAAYRFIGAHFSQGKLRTTENATATCPFFATCDNALRKAKANQCSQQPWLAISAGPLTCDYSFAVHVTRPPSAELRKHDGHT